MHFEKEEKIIQRIDSLLEKDPELLKKPINLTKDTLLHYAAYHKKKLVIQHLLNKGADPEQQNTWGVKPIDLIEKDPLAEDESQIEEIKEIMKTHVQQRIQAELN